MIATQSTEIGAELLELARAAVEARGAELVELPRVEREPVAPVRRASPAPARGWSSRASLLSTLAALVCAGLLALIL